MIKNHADHPAVLESPARRKAVEEAVQLRQILSPHAGKWVALSHDWRRVIAFDADHRTCIHKAKEALVGSDELPCFYRVPADGD